MKIGTKLAICFVALAVVPLGAASWVYLRTTSEFGSDMASRGKNLLEDWVHRDLRRASELGAVTIEQTREEIAREVRFLSSEISARLNTAEDNTQEDNGQAGYILEPEPPQAPASGTRRIDLEQMSVHMAEDATRDRIASMLRRLSGLSETARTIYLRSRGAIDTLTITFEDGITISYPGRAARFETDPREMDWYLSTLEALETSWFDSDTGRISVAAPVQLPDGRLIGAARISIRLDVLLTRSIDATRMPPGADAYLIKVPKDDPELMPHEVATYVSGKQLWKIADQPQAVPLNGDDGWLKVVSDIRSGVPGLEYVELGGKKQIWSFGPVGTTVGASYHIAVTLPSEVISAVNARVEEVVATSYRDQFRTAIAFTLAAGLIAAALAVFGAKTLTSPIRRLHEAASKLARGDFSARVEHTGHDEIGDLARGFNRMVPALEEQIRVKRDLFAAQEIQQQLVPATPPAIEGFEIAGRTIYCEETGGDYLDYVPLAPDRFAIAVGDVTGHGIGAALLMTSARALIRANAPHHDTAAGLLAAVNQQIAEDSSGGRSLTLFYMELHAGSHDVDWLSAGHEPALMYDPREDSLSVLEGEDIPLGVDAEWAFHGRRTAIPERGILLAFTDGIREARNGDGEEYGLDRLKEVVRRMHDRSSEVLLQAVLSDLETFRGSIAVADDMSVVVIKRS
ncbi:MAG: SpoIIE family protein phosphatase [Rhodospirillales bacterium]|nr:SpoIIE family protein phosphatase [Rhodospirillales bacterium]MBO6787831.1 SpoIIE family protein phosphatase [Rhodospirillales bacterium]